MIKKGCFLALGIWIATYGAYWWFLHGKVEWPGDAFLSLFGSIGLLILVSSLKQVVFGDENLAALKRAEQGLPLEDGKQEAVWGAVAPVGPPLTAPFTGRSCVAYEYDVKRDAASDEESAPGSEASGWALAPAVIQSNRGLVRVLGFGMLDEFESKDCASDPEAQGRAAAFFGATSFEQMGLLRIGKMISELDDLLVGEADSTRRDWKFASGPLHPDGNRLQEKVVGVGQTVTAVGVWDASRGGLVPKHGGKTVPVKLMPGGGLAMVRWKSKRPWGLLLFSLVWSGFAHVMIWVALVNR